MKKILISILLTFLLAFAFVSAAGDLTASIDSINKSGDPGADVTFSFTLKNSGVTDISSISITSTDLTGSEGTLTAPVVSSITTLTNTTDQSVNVVVSIPSVVNAGTYSGTLTAVDGANASNTDSLIYSVAVNAIDSFSVDPSSIDIDMQADQNNEEDITITNTGSTTLNSWSFSFLSDDGDSGFIEDDDEDRIDISFNPSNASLNPGESMTLEVDADVDQDVDEGSNYDGDITISAIGTAKINTSVPLSITIAPEICELGKQGSDFNIDIQDPDSGDNFGPGDTVEIDVDVENEANDDLDVVVEAILINEDNGDREKSDKETRNIDENDEESFTFNFDLPTNLDPDDTYYLYIQAHEEGDEDDSCDYERVRLDIELEDEDVSITETSLTPSTGLSPGEEYRVSIEVESTGLDDLDDVYIELRDGDLDVSETSAPFDLGDHNDNDNDYRVTFDLTIPSDTVEGSYYLEAIVYDDNGNAFDDALILVEVEGDGSSSGSSGGAGSLQVTLSDDYDVKGNELTLSIILENIGSDTKIVDLNAGSVDWATLNDVELLRTIAAGDTVHAYMYFTLDEDTEGEHSLQIIASDDAGNVVSELVTIDFGEKDETAKGSLFSGKLFGEDSGSTWIVLDIILVILAIVFLAMLFRKR